MNCTPVLALLCFPAVLGCADPSSVAGGGAKADDPGEVGELHCLVAHVRDDGVLEEGLSAVFDVDRVGLPAGDADGTVVRVAPDGSVASLGHHQFSRAGGDRIVAIATEDTANSPRHGYRITSGEQTFEIRVFTKSGLGTLSFEETGKAARHIATLDCRPGARAPNEDDAHAVANCAGTLFEGGHCRFRNGQFAAGQCCRASCDVAIVDDDNVLEEGLGALYDIDLDGFTLGDEDARSVSIDLTAAAGASGWRVGQHRFAEDGGDVLHREPGLESEFQRFLIDTAGGLAFEIRIFDTSRLGVILVKKENESAAHILSRLDCRGLARPASID